MYAFSIIFVLFNFLDKKGGSYFPFFANDSLISTFIECFSAVVVTDIDLFKLALHDLYKLTWSYTFDQMKRFI